MMVMLMMMMMAMMLTITLMIDDVVECGDNDDDQALKSIPDGSRHQADEERDTDYSGKKR